MKFERPLRHTDKSPDAYKALYTAFCRAYDGSQLLSHDLQVRVEILAESGLDELLTTVDSNLVSMRTSTEEKGSRPPDLNRAWTELLFCLLAGTIIRSESADLAFRWLKYSLPEVSTPRGVSSLPDAELAIAQALCDVGYRFPASKSATIVSAAYFILENWTSVAERLAARQLNAIRSEMVREVHGVGLKITSHWFRNLGLEWPVVDIHVRRFLECTAVLPPSSSEKPLSPRDYLRIEGILWELSRATAIPAGRLDWAIWVHARGACSVGETVRCPVAGTCRRDFATCQR